MHETRIQKLRQKTKLKRKMIFIRKMTDLFIHLLLHLFINNSRPIELLVIPGINDFIRLYPKAI